MAESQVPAPSPTQTTQQPAPGPKPRWGLRIGLGAAALVLVSIAFIVARSFMPVWWATRVTSQTQGSLSGGLLLGLSYGFIFTFVPLLIGWQSRYKKVSWPWKSVILGLAVLVALPNLLTLGIYMNSSGAALKAQMMIDTSATWFPSWTLGGAIAGLVLFIGIAVFWHLWRSRGRKMKVLQQEAKARSTPAPAARQAEPVGTASGTAGDEPGSGLPGESASGLPEN